jgi:hypothetical protein
MNRILATAALALYALALLLPPVPRARRGRARGLSSRFRHRIVHMPSAI